MQNIFTSKVEQSFLSQSCIQEILWTHLKDLGEIIKTNKACFREKSSSMRMNIYWSGQLAGSTISMRWMQNILYPLIEQICDFQNRWHPVFKYKLLTQFMLIRESEFFNRLVIKFEWVSAEIQDTQREPFSFIVEVLINSCNMVKFPGCKLSKCPPIIQW